MEFRTIVDVEDPGFRIEPCEEVLFVGSCFADNIGARFKEEKFRATVNPFGVMYNPASILHTVERLSLAEPSILGSLRTAFFTLGTNHIYRLKETGEIVDNCQKRPQSLFTEEVLTVDECANYLQKAIDILRAANPDIHVVLTVSPIRYRNRSYRKLRFCLPPARWRAQATSPPTKSSTMSCAIIASMLRICSIPHHRPWNTSGSDFPKSISAMLPSSSSKSGNPLKLHLIISLSTQNRKNIAYSWIKLC